MKSTVVEAVFQKFTDGKKAFDVYSDARGAHLGELIMQGQNILACHLRSLITHQIN